MGKTICVERRQGERRQGERRRVERAGPDRRQGDRRKAAGAAGVLALTAVLGRVPAADAQIYTRTNARGVIEATDVPEPAGGYKLAFPKRLGVVIHSAEFRLRPSSNRAYDEHIGEAAARFHLSVAFVKAVIQTESAFDRLAVSSVGARGLMQLMPATARRFGVRDSFDARQNIFAGAQYLRVLLDMFGGDTVLACAAYNAGEGTVRRYAGVPPYAETRAYVRKIHALLGEAPVLFASLTPAAVQGTSARPAVARAAKPRTLYRWVDADGTPHLTDEPPADRPYMTVRATD
jgi:soluble lytic murein transglycosylase-like protein